MRISTIRSTPLQGEQLDWKLGAKVLPKAADLVSNVPLVSSSLMSRLSPSLRAKTAGVLAISSVCFLGTKPALAVGSPEPEAIGKGIVGGALVLSELTLTIEAAVGVKPWWGYALGGGLGAVGGAIGGYFIADAAGPEIPTGMLIGGLVLAVPTTIFVLSQTAYRPPETEVLDESVAFAESRMTMAPLPRVPSLVERDAKGQFGFGIPAVSMGFAPTVAVGQTAHSFEIPVLDLQFR
jgi:hypothetical protein